jgi:hypothetical protein
LREGSVEESLPPDAYIWCQPGYEGWWNSIERTDAMATTQTGTADVDYDIIWFTEQCLSNAQRLETYIGDADQAGDRELADFFRKAQADSRKGAEQGKQLLRKHMANA